MQHTNTNTNTKREQRQNLKEISSPDLSKPRAVCGGGAVDRLRLVFSWILSGVYT